MNWLTAKHQTSAANNEIDTNIDERHMVKGALRRLQRVG